MNKEESHFLFLVYIFQEGMIVHKNVEKYTKNPPFRNGTSN